MSSDAVPHDHKHAESKEGGKREKQHLQPELRVQFKMALIAVRKKNLFPKKQYHIMY